MPATSLGELAAPAAASPRPQAVSDAAWLVGFPVVALALFAIAFHAMWLEAGRVAAPETGTCSRHALSTMMHTMLAMH